MNNFFKRFVSLVLCFSTLVLTYPSVSFSKENKEKNTVSKKLEKETNEKESKEENKINESINNTDRKNVTLTVDLKGRQAQMRFYREDEKKLGKPGTLWEDSDENYTIDAKSRIDDTYEIKKIRPKGNAKPKIGTPKIVQVEQTFKDGTTITREVTNYLDENGKEYDIYSNDEATRKKATEELLKRQFLVADEQYENEARIIGYSTIPLCDMQKCFWLMTGKYNQDTTHYLYKYMTLQQYEDLLSHGKVIRNLDDWKKADEAAEEFKKKKPMRCGIFRGFGGDRMCHIYGENGQKDIYHDGAYLVDEKSPIDKDRTIYPIYACGRVVLHSRNYDEDGSELTKTIYLSRSPKYKEDLRKFYYKKTKKKKPSKNAQALRMYPDVSEKFFKKHMTDVFVDMPEVPIFGDEKHINEVKEEDRIFAKEDQSFIGWVAINESELTGLTGKARQEKIDQLLNKFEAGQNNDRIEEMNEMTDGKGYEKLNKLRHDNFMPNDQELKNIYSTYYALRKDKKDSVKETNDGEPTYPEGELIKDDKDYPYIYLPNGYKLWMNALDFRDDPKIKTARDVLDRAEVHLYAVYRPRFKVSVSPRYMDINRTDVDPTHQYGKYEALKEEYNTAKKDLDIALLTRTAVTDYTKPTVAANANYNPINELLKKDEPVFKTWNKNSQEPLI